MTHKDPTAKQVSYPRRCGACGAKESVQAATISHTSNIKHDGRLYEVTVPDLHVFKCNKCGEILFGNEADEQIAAALRVKLGLLTPEQIKENRAKLGIRQKDLAEHLGAAEETISRWECGLMIQSRAMDKFMRLYFEDANVRVRLAGTAQPTISHGIVVIVDAHRYGIAANSAAEQCLAEIRLSSPHEHCDWSRLQRPEVKDLLQGVFAMTCEGNLEFVSTVGTILRGYGRIVRKYTDDLQQLRICGTHTFRIENSQGYRHLKRLERLTSNLVEMRDEDRDFFVKSFLPMTERTVRQLREATAHHRQQQPI